MTRYEHLEKDELIRLLKRRDADRQLGRAVRMSHKQAIRCIYIDPPYNTGNWGLRLQRPAAGSCDCNHLNRMTLSKLVNQHGANVRTDVLDKLCTFLGCRIEDLAEHVPGASAGHADIVR
ncbi:MAG: helix-turn-helix transcriptional regulator [Pseudoxanthomonas suwonensis]|nr:helix-turn-helix transcriptional regulator [Pseudoxanthomonas suwonensis]